MPATPPPAPGGIGRTLREARERRGVSLRQISNTTRIAVSVLESLERDDISRLPGGIFSRAFVRSYAVEVGLDPEETIRQFIAQFPVDSVTAGHPAVRAVDDGEGIASRQRTAAVFGRLIAASVLIVALMLYFGSRSRTPEVESGSAAPELDRDVLTAEPGAAGLRADVPPPAPEVDGSRAAPEPRTDRLLVGLAASGPCWVSVTVDGRAAFAREMRAGERELVEARQEVTITAGDASALRLTLNGQDARPLGAAGRVVTVRLTLAGYKQYLAAP
jgi:cytoskeleton protein RodZ